MNSNLFGKALLASLLICCGFLWANCNRTIDSILPHTELIFPLDSGKYRITLVIDTLYEAAGPVADTYYKKEVVEGTEVDLTGRTVTRLQTYRSEVSNGTNFNFKYERLYTLYRDPDGNGTRYAERIEENNRFIVLKFPAHPGIEWNGNLFNILDTQVYKYQSVDSTVTINGMTFEDCVVVIQKDNRDGLIRDEFAYEIYAPNIGRIKKYDRTLVSDGPNGEFNASESRIYIEEIVEHN